MSTGAPWRRAARPLAILFSLQLSGVGCAARTAEIAAPTRPSEMKPYLRVYQDQLEQGGMTLEATEDYLAGRSVSPIREDGKNGMSEGLAPGGSSSAGSIAVGTFADAAESVSAYPAQPQPGSEPTFKVVDGVAEYRIGPGDVLGITPFLGPEVPTTITLRVQADGNIFIARFSIGAVQATGSTATELSRVITDLYREYVPTAFVEVRVDQHNAWSATVMGSIAGGLATTGPGTYPLRGRTTVTEFIFTHGGPLEEADLSDVRLVRNGSETRIDLTTVLGGRGGNDPTLQSGDLLHVPSVALGSSDSRFFLLGEVHQPGVQTYVEGTSVIDAIAQAGGYTTNAGTNKILLTRPATSEVIRVDLDVYLGEGQAASAPTVQAGDFIVVPFRDRGFSERLRDWVAITGLILSAATIWALVKN